MAEVVFISILLMLNLAVSIGETTDDMYFYTIGTAPEFTYGGWVKDMWFGWSSRLIINCLCVFFATAPYVVWKIVNTICMAVIPMVVYKITGNTEENDIKIFTLLCFFMIPHIVTGEAGWIATSSNYVLPTACLMICCIPIWKIIYERQIISGEWIIYCLAAFVATDSEQGSFCVFAMYSICLAWMLFQQKKQYEIEIIVLSIISVIRLLMTFLCPGNQVRKGLIIKENYPEYGGLTFFQKFQAGVYSVASDMFLIFFSLTLLMTTLLMALVWKKEKQRYKCVIASVPFAANIVLPIGGCLLILKEKYIEPGIVWKTAIKNALTSLGILGMKNMIWDSLPIVFYTVLIAVYICIFLSVYWIFGKTGKMIVTELVLFLGCCTKGMIGFTGSVWLSHSRTGYYMAISEIFVLVQMYRHMKSTEIMFSGKKILTILVPFAVLNIIVSFLCVTQYAVR